MWLAGLEPLAGPSAPSRCQLSRGAMRARPGRPSLRAPQGHHRGHFLQALVTSSGRRVEVTRTRGRVGSTVCLTRARFSPAPFAH